MKQHTFAIIN